MAYSVTANFPEEAAKMLAKKKIKEGFILEDVYEFQDAQGNIMFWRLRFKHQNGKKYIPSMHLLDDRYYLGDPPDFKDNKKPLYCLYKLLQMINPVVYTTQNQAGYDRLCDSAFKLASKLGHEGNVFDGFYGKKPKGMHWKTYARKVEEIENLKRRGMAGATARFGW